MDSGYLFPVFVFLAAACVVVPLASRFKLGAVLGYLLAGILIGPFGLKLIGNPEQIMHFAEFGVVMMLFVIGLELEPAVLWQRRFSLLGLGGLQMALTSAAFTAIGIAMGFGWQASLSVGMALSLSSTALVLQMLEERNLLHTDVGENVLSVLLFQDIAVIPILIILPLLAAHGVTAEAHHTTMLDSLPGWAHALVVAGVIAGVIAAGHYLSRPVFRIIARTRLREVFTATSLALIIGITLLMQMVGVSPALGAFVAGVVLAGSEYRHTLETDLEPFKGLLLGLFFISVGMGIDFDLFAQKPLELLMALVILFGVKALILFPLGRRFGITERYNIGFAVGLAQGGEFAFVLLQFAANLNIIPLHYSQFLTLVVTLSIAATPLLMTLYSRYIVPRFMSVLSERAFDTIDENNPVIIAGFGRFGQIIGRFLSGQGIKITVLEKDPDQIELLRKFGNKGYFGDASRLDLLRSAGAEKARMLVIAVDDVNTSLDIARLAREHFPNLALFARARNRRHTHELHKIGVNYFKRETFDSSLAMAQDIMVFLGKSAAEMQAKAAAFKAHDEESLVKSFAFFDNEPELVNFSKTQREELERILQSDTSEKPA